MPGAMGCLRWSVLPARTTSMLPTCSPSPPLRLPRKPAERAPNGRKPPNGSIHRPRQPKPLLAIEPSAALRDQLVAEIQQLKDTDDLALWAHRRLPAKNTLTADDALAVEAAIPGCAGLVGRATVADRLKRGDGGPRSTADQSPISLPAAQDHPQARQGPFSVRRSTAVSTLPVRTMRCAPSKVCSTAVAWSQGQRRIHCPTMP